MSKLEMGRARAWSKGGACALILAQAAIGCANDASPSSTGTAVVSSASLESTNKPLSDTTQKKDKQADGKDLDTLHGGGLGIVGAPRTKGMGGIPAGGPVGGNSAQGDEGSMGIAAPRLDPNARYATTYRPGGASLAAFDAALTKGSIAASYKDLVGDFGGRYAPTITKPESSAMAFVVETERGALPKTGGFVGVRIAMRSNDVMPARAPLSVHLVLDVSGSMQGLAIDNAKKAAAALVERLEPGDDFSMVTFSNDAHLLVPDGLIGARRPQVLAKIKEVKADGGTNISSGLDLAYAQAHTKTIDPDAVKIVMLLSDGHANGGDTSFGTLTDRSAKAFQDGIQTSSFGVGEDFDASLMSTIADKGAGGYYYLPDSTQIASALGKELDARLVPVAQAIEIRLRLRPDIAATKVFGSHMLDGVEAALVRAQETAVDGQVKKKDGIAKDRDHDAEGGMRFFMPAFARDDHHAMLLDLKVPAGIGERVIASVEIRYKDRLRKKNVTEEIPLKIKYADSESDSAKTINGSVAATIQAFTAGDVILRAAALVDAGDRVGAARVLTERSELLKTAAVTLAEPKLAEDAGRLARLSSAVVSGAQVSENLALAVMLRGSAYGYLR